uniref:HTH myb-type domain-containing protein n=1 Tax=Brassica campestris TaxID=3711 RepID=M4DF62_BRACM
MSSQEQKKKEKGKEIVTSEENPTTSEVSMYFSEQGIAALLEANKKDNAEKVGTQQKKSSSSKIKPCIFYTSDEKARLRWSSDLHACFVKAVEKLGGPDKATPKAVKDTMEVEGIALHHVKSHLQKFRLGRCNIRDETDQYHKRFINPYVTTEPQSMPGSSTVTTQPELQLNDDCLIHDLYRNPSFLPTSVPQTVDSLHQVISNITSPLSTAPQPIQTYAPNHTYNYPEYNTLERVKAQLSALQYSSTSRIQATPFCETNLSSSVTRDDEEDPVDMYIDWGKYEEVDIDELDPVEALLALGFSVSP